MKKYFLGNFSAFFKFCLWKPKKCWKITSKIFFEIFFSKIRLFLAITWFLPSFKGQLCPGVISRHFFDFEKSTFLKIENMPKKLPLEIIQSWNFASRSLLPLEIKFLKKKFEKNFEKNSRIFQNFWTSKNSRIFFRNFFEFVFQKSNFRYNYIFACKVSIVSYF